jgi:hypothetical protein
MISTIVLNWNRAEQLNDDAIVLFHDTSEHHAAVLEGVKKLIQDQAIIGLNFATRRGLFSGHGQACSTLTSSRSRSSSSRSTASK